MRGFTFLGLAAVAGIGFATLTPKAEAQVTGAGPWFHGARDFQGNVNNRLHPEHGYKGPTPQRGEKAETSKRVDSAHFQGNEARDGRGHIAGGKK
jgi:hypothetical protein